MHNCKSTINSLIELALDDLSPAESARWLAELKDCRTCQEEFATIKSTLRTSGQALQSALPPEDFWPGYHARLQAALENSWALQNENQQTGRAPQRIEIHPPGTPPCPRSQPAARSAIWLALRSLMTTSVRVPAPVAAALLLLFGTVAFFAVYHHPTRAARAGTPVSRGPATPRSVTATATDSTPAPTRIVEVPVIKEKVVTRVVYVETSRRPPNAPNDSNEVNDGRDDDISPLIDVTSGVARVRPDPRSAAMSLAGFKPTDEVKLTIIKGSDPK